MTDNTEALPPLPDFEQWWQEHGQFCRAGGGDYEKTFAFRAWEAALAQRQQVPERTDVAQEAPEWMRSFYSMESAPLDGTLVRLLVRFDNNEIEDTGEPTVTIGSHNDGEWNFVGWCWHTDEWARGSGDLLGWLPLQPAALTAAPSAQAEPQGELCIVKNEAGQIVAVTRCDAYGRILETIAESAQAEPQVPLTDEQIDMIAADGMRNAAGGIYATRVYEFARAIERAHGIGKQEGT